MSQPVQYFSDDEVDDYEIGNRQKFSVTLPEDFDPSVPPCSGEEFLQHVLYESRKYAPILIAERVDGTLLNARCDPQIPLKSQIQSRHWTATEEWRAQQVDCFEKLRNRILSLRLGKSVEVQKIIVPDVEILNNDWLEFLKNHEPRLSVLFAMSQEQLERALKALLGVQVMTVVQGAWVYSICACLEHPLSRLACGDLRDMARKCAALRDSENELGEDTLLMTNLIITLVVQYFRQTDLCEFKSDDP